MDSASTVLNMVKDLSYSARWQRTCQAGREMMMMKVDDPRRHNQVNVLQFLAASSNEYERTLAAMALHGCFTEAPSSSEAASSTQLGEDPTLAVLYSVVRALLLDESPRLHQLLVWPVLRSFHDDTLMELLGDLPVRRFTAIAHFMKHHHLRDEVLKKLFQRARNAQEPSQQRWHLLVVLGTTSDDLDALMPTPKEQWIQPTEVLEGLSDAHPSWMLSRLHQQVKEALASSGIIHEDLSRNIIITLRRFLHPRHPTNHRCGMELMTATLHYLNADANVVCAVVHLALTAATVETARYLAKIGDVFSGVELTLSSSMWVRLRREHDAVMKMVQLHLVTRVSEPYRFSMLPPSVRRELFQHRRGLFETSSEEPILLSILKALPDESARHAEAHRAFHHTHLQDDVRRRLPYLSILPYPQLLPLAQESLMSPDPSLRIAAIDVVLESLCYHPQHLMDVLKYCEGRCKEQDPWRGTVFTGLAKLPQKHWLAQDATLCVERMISAAMKAVDLSISSTSAMQHLLMRMLDADPHFAVNTILSLIRHRNNNFYGGRLLRQASRAAQQHLIIGIQPLMLQWLRKKQHTKLLHVLNDIGDVVLRPRRVELQPLMLACINAPHEALATRGLAMLYAFFPETAAELIPSLLMKKPHWKYNHLVRRVVEGALQGEVLDSCLRPLAHLGNGSVVKRLDAATEEYVMSFSHMHRWTATAQCMYADILLQLLHSKSEDVFYEQELVLQQLVRVPSAPIASIMAEMVKEDATDELLHHFGIQCLGARSDKESLHILMEALNDSRSRFAILAMQRRLKNARVTMALELLSPVLHRETQLITVQKEICRFVGDLADQRGLDLLIHFAASRELHRDVLVALLRGLRHYLDEEPTWALLETSIGTANSHLGTYKAVCSIPDAKLRKTWQRQRFARLMEKLLHNNRREVQRAAIDRIMSSSASIMDQPYLQDALLSMLPLRIFAHDATLALVKMPTLPVDILVRHIMQLSSDVLLQAVVEAVERSHKNAGTQQRAALEAIMMALVDALLHARRQPDMAVGLILHIRAPATYWINSLLRMEAWGVVHPGAMVSAVGKISSYTFLEDRSLDELQQAERDVLRHHSRPFMRRCGLALLEGMAEEHDWSCGRRKALEEYQGDDDLWVCGDARLVDLPNDKDTDSAHQP